MKQGNSPSGGQSPVDAMGLEAVSYPCPLSLSGAMIGMDSDMDYNNITPRLWIGSSPRGVDEINHMVSEARISAILSLLTDQDLERFGVDGLHIQSHCFRRGIELHRMPVKDGDSEDLREKLPDCVLRLDRLLASGHTVYLHCAAGIERSPSVAIAYFNWCMGYSLEEATAFVKDRRGCSPDLDAIALATRDLLSGEDVRQRIHRKALEISEGLDDAVWEEARKLVLRELIMERSSTL